MTNVLFRKNPRQATLLMVVFSVLLTAALTAAGLVAGQMYAEERISATREYLQRKVEQYGELIERGINLRSRVIAIASSASSVDVTKQGQQALTDRLNEVQAVWPEMVWIGVTDRQGKVLAAVNNQLVGRDVSARPWFSEGLKGPYLSPLHEAVLLAYLMTPNIEGDLPRLFDIAHPIRNTDGQVLGVIAAHLSDSFFDSVRQVIGQTSTEGHPYELHIYEPDGQPIGFRRLPALDERILSATPNRGSVITQMGSGSDERLVAHMRLRLRGTQPVDWIATASMQMSGLQREVRALQLRMLGLGLLGALLCLPLVALFSAYLAAPLAALSRVVRQGREANQLSPEHVPVTGTAETAQVGGEIRNLLSDIAARNEALRDNEARLAALVDSAPDAIISIDEHGKIVLFNPAAETMFGVPAAVIMGRPLDELVPVAFHNAHTRHIAGFRAGSEDRAAMGRIRPVTGRRANGEEFPIEASVFRTRAAGSLRLTAIIRDVTERQRNEVALRMSELRYRDLFFAHPMPMWIYDIETLAFLEVNEVAVAKYGWTRDEFLKMTVLDITPEAEHAAMRVSIKNAGSSNFSSTGPWAHLLKDGTQILVETFSHGTQWVDRSARLAVAYDVTQRLRADAEVRRQREELSELSRQLMDKEAHERAVLGQILHDNFAQNLAAAKLGIEASTRQLANPAATEAMRAAALEALKPVVGLLGDAIYDVRGLLNDLRPPLLDDFGLRQAFQFELERRQATTSTKLHLLPAQAEVEPRLDATVEYGLFMITREAMLNAINHAQASLIEFDFQLEQGSAKVRITDNGKGFDPSTPGLGAGHLGLVGMKERARWIDAQLVLDSAPSQGTRVTVRWSASAANAL